MKDPIWPGYLYNFLKLIASSPLEKKILDCGAGGAHPPLTLFYKKGYETHGVDISERSIQAANSFAEKHQINLILRKADMRNLPYDDESFSFVSTQNSLCHLTKADHKKSIEEMSRVLRKDGYLFVDFMSTDSSFCNEEEMGELVGDHEYSMKDRDFDNYHSFFRNDEPEDYFVNMKVIQKERVISENKIAEIPYTDVRLYYYVQKP